MRHECGRPVHEIGRDVVAGLVVDRRPVLGDVLDGGFTIAMDIALGRRDEEARAKTEAIRQRALAGESFEKLAADLSDAPSRANAGLIGPLNLSDLSQDVRNLIDPMNPGDVTQVMRSNKGYQILKLETKSTAELMPFDKAREDISNRVFTNKRNEEFQKYLTKLRGQAIIEWKNPELKKAYDEGLKLPAKS